MLVKTTYKLYCALSVNYIRSNMKTVLHVHVQQRQSFSVLLEIT